jgi:CheY-like chemotaxis protein
MVSQAAPISIHSEPEQTPVLIVEDEATSRRALSMLLSGCGYRPEAFASGEAALRALQRGPRPRIAHIDLDLPGMNGLDLIRHLEQLDPSVFPVLITATSSEVLAAKLHDRPIAYLRKPLDFDNLLALLHQQQMNN